MTFFRNGAAALGFLTLASLCLGLFSATSHAASTAAELDREATLAVARLIEKNPAAAGVAENAKAVLIFPSIIKAGLIFGGAYGEGVLKKGDEVVDYYNSVSGSWGLQAGAQTYSYVVFLMNDKALEQLERTKGWELGAGPSLVVVNEGVAKNLSTSTLTEDAYAFIFSQQGAMASLSIEGTKISRIER
jgi:lipid-binding SYLF domain-containing protein